MIAARSPARSSFPSTPAPVATSSSTCWPQRRLQRSRHRRLLRWARSSGCGAGFRIWRMGARARYGDEPRALAPCDIEPFGRTARRSGSPTVDVPPIADGAPADHVHLRHHRRSRRASWSRTTRVCAAAMLGQLFGYQPDERPYTGLSLTHGNAQSVTLAPALLHGSESRVQPPFHAIEAVGRVPAHGCTTFSLVGGMATAHLQRGAPARRRRQPGADGGQRRHAGRLLGGLRGSVRPARSSSSTARWTAAESPGSRSVRDRSDRSASPCRAWR